MAFSPDGHTLASASANTFVPNVEKIVRLWDVSTGRERRNLAGHTSPVEGLAFSPDGRTLASASSDDGVRLWDPATGQVRRVLRGQKGGSKQLAFSPDGRILAASNSTPAVQLWDTATGQEVRALRLGGESDICSGLSFSPDGQTLAEAFIEWSNDEDHTVKLWDPATGQEKASLRGHPARVFHPAFSPDGRRLASSCLYGTVCVWDLATSRMVLILHAASFSAQSPKFSPDGRKLVTTSDATVKIWDATPMTPEQRVIREARGVIEFLAAKSLTKDEIVARIRRDPTISEPVRKQALDLAQHAAAPAAGVSDRAPGGKTNPAR